MDRKGPEKPTHKDFFRFQMRINEILSEYDIGELELFYRTSRKGFPHLATLVMELIYLAQKGVESGELPDEKQERMYATTLLDQPSRSRSMLAEESRSTKIMEYKSVLESRIVFPKNEDLGMFAESTLKMKTGWRWDSRENMVQKIWNRILELPIDGRNKIFRRIQNIALKSNIQLDPPIEDSFFTSWERIIRDSGRSGND